MRIGNFRDWLETTFESIIFYDFNITLKILDEYSIEVFNNEMSIGFMEYENYAQCFSLYNKNYDFIKTFDREYGFTHTAAYSLLSFLNKCMDRIKLEELFNAA